MNASPALDLLAPALVAAQSEMRAIGKGGYNKYDGYAYATLEDYVRAVSPVLAKHGLSVITSVDDLHFVERTTSKGNKENGAAVKMSVILLHTSGQYMTAACVGEGQDRADKATYKAITGARKYALASIFGLATTDDPEGDESVGRSDTAQPKASTPRSPQKAATGKRNKRTPEQSAQKSNEKTVHVHHLSLPERAESLLPEQWNEYISQLPGNQLMQCFNSANENDGLRGNSDVWSAICNSLADRGRATLKMGSKERKALAAALKPHRS